MSINIIPNILFSPRPISVPLMPFNGFINGINIPHPPNQILIGDPDHHLIVPYPMINPFRLRMINGPLRPPIIINLKSDNIDDLIEELNKLKLQNISPSQNISPPQNIANRLVTLRDVFWREKYLKYKAKYLDLKGGFWPFTKKTPIKNNIECIIYNFIKEKYKNDTKILEKFTTRYDANVDSDEEDIINNLIILYNNHEYIKKLYTKLIANDKEYSSKVVKHAGKFKENQKEFDEYSENDGNIKDDIHAFKIKSIELIKKINTSLTKYDTDYYAIYVILKKIIDNINTSSNLSSFIKINKRNETQRYIFDIIVKKFETMVEKKYNKEFPDVNIDPKNKNYKSYISNEKNINEIVMYLFNKHQNIRGNPLSEEAYKKCGTDTTELDGIAKYLFMDEHENYLKDIKRESEIPPSSQLIEVPATYSLEKSFSSFSSLSPSSSPSSSPLSSPPSSSPPSSSPLSSPPLSSPPSSSPPLSSPPLSSPPLSSSKASPPSSDTPTTELLPTMPQTQLFNIQNPPNAVNPKGEIENCNISGIIEKFCDVDNTNGITFKQKCEYGGECNENCKKYWNCKFKQDPSNYQKVHEKIQRKRPLETQSPSSKGKTQSPSSEAIPQSLLKPPTLQDLSKTPSTLPPSLLNPPILQDLSKTSPKQLLISPPSSKSPPPPPLPPSNEILPPPLVSSPPPLVSFNTHSKAVMLHSNWENVYRRKLLELRKLIVTQATNPYAFILNMQLNTEFNDQSNCNASLIKLRLLKYLKSNLNQTIKMCRFKNLNEDITKALKTTQSMLKDYISKYEGTNNKDCGTANTEADASKVAKKIDKEYLEYDEVINGHFEHICKENEKFEPKTNISYMCKYKCIEKIINNILIKINEINEKNLSEIKTILNKDFDLYYLSPAQRKTIIEMLIIEMKEKEKKANRMDQKVLKDKLKILEKELKI